MDFKLLKKLRSDNMLSQLQAAELIGVDIKTIKNWENGSIIPTQRSQAEIVRAFFHNDKRAFDCYFSNDQTTSGNQTHSDGDWNFSGEKSILANAIQKNNIEANLVEPLQLLLDASVGDAEIRALSTILAALQRTPMDCNYILGELAAIVQSATNIRTDAESESLTRDLIFQLEYIESNTDLSASCRREIPEIISSIKNARLSNAPSDRLIARRRCFYFMCDNYASLKNCASYYRALSSIIIPLSGTSYNADARRHLFYNLLSMAEKLNQNKGSF